MKKKMDFMTKAKLMYSGELLFFAVVFIVIAILELLEVLKINGTFFNWVTIFGGTWLFIDFSWAYLSEKRRKKVALIDKVLVLPIAAYVIAFDIFCFAMKPDKSIYHICIPIAILYLCSVYIFQAFYHYKYPIPGLLDIEEKAKEAEQEEQEVSSEEQLIEEKKEEENA